MIAFVDVPPGTRFLPQAAELNDGRVVTFFSPLIEKLKRDGGTLPVAYPETTTTDEGRRQRDAYWRWFTDHWNADKAVQVVEDVIGAGNPALSSGRCWDALLLTRPGQVYQGCSVRTLPYIGMSDTRDQLGRPR
jgi:hypothetical protein